MSLKYNYISKNLFFFLIFRYKIFILTELQRYTIKNYDKFIKSHIKKLCLKKFFTHNTSRLFYFNIKLI